MAPCEQPPRQFLIFLRFKPVHEPAGIPSY